ncbi:hypothetical protein HYW87_03730 [Candidatus Roizmanbacteria bacterium]|nr:hypothetical protein [Candidatus Roizmanbacteria bacterium]
MPDLQGEISIIKESLKHHRIAFYAVLLFVMLLGLIVIGLLREKIVTPLTPPSTSKTGAVVELQSEFKNPFDKNAQYVNPFQQVKNPFDLIK